MSSQTGAQVGMSDDDEVRRMLLDVVEHPPHMRTSGPHSRDSPADLGALRRKSGRDPIFSQLEWDTLHNPLTLNNFVPMTKEEGTIPAIVWSPDVDRDEDPHFSINQLTEIVDLALVYDRLSRLEKKERIRKLVVDEGIFKNLDARRRKTSVQRAVSRKANTLLKKKLEIASHALQSAQTRGDSVSADNSAQVIVSLTSAFTPEED